MMTGLIGRRLTEERRRHLAHPSPGHGGPIYGVTRIAVESPAFPPCEAQNHSAGNTASTPFFFSMTTRNFAGFVALALRPTVCTSLGPS
jgi:hypothetical protein